MRCVIRFEKTRVQSLVDRATILGIVIERVIESRRSRIEMKSFTGILPMYKESIV